MHRGHHTRRAAGPAPPCEMLLFHRADTEARKGQVTQPRSSKVSRSQGQGRSLCSPGGGFTGRPLPSPNPPSSCRTNIRAQGPQCDSNSFLTRQDLCFQPDLHQRTLRWLSATPLREKSKTQPHVPQTPLRFPSTPQQGEPGVTAPLPGRGSGTASGTQRETSAGHHRHEASAKDSPAQGRPAPSCPSQRQPPRTGPHTSGHPPKHKEAQAVSPQLPLASVLGFPGERAPRRTRGPLEKTSPGPTGSQLWDFSRIPPLGGRLRTRSRATNTISAASKVLH